MGRYFGFGNQLLMLFGCLVVIALCVSGAVILIPKKRVAKFCDRVGESALALRIAAEAKRRKTKPQPLPRVKD
jgi:uncharacterized iron-regulated membrane protein